MSPSINIHDSIGSPSAPKHILYINPNSTLAFTLESITHLKDHSVIPSHVRVDFYTAPSATAPPSIDGSLDGVISTATILKDLGIIPSSSGGGGGGGGRVDQSGMETLRDLAERYGAVVVGCFSMHPLVPCLKEAFSLLQAGEKEGQGETSKVPRVIGIMEASIVVALKSGEGKFGIATTGISWEPLFDSAVRGLGIDPSRYAGTKGSGFNAISLHGDGPFESLVGASLGVVKQGAEVVVLGCAGMAPLRAKIEEEVSRQSGKAVQVIDCVQAGLELAISG